MSVTREQTPFEPPSDETLTTALTELEATRDSFLNASARYIQIPTASNLDQLIEHAAQTARSIYNFTECVIEDQVADNQQKGSILAATLINEENKRVACFNGLVGNKPSTHFKPSIDDAEKLGESIARQLESSDEKDDESKEDRLDDLLEKLTSAYGENLSTDMGRLVDLGSKSTKAKVLNTCKFIGRHSVEIAKISAGVAVGSFVMKGLERRKS